MMHIYHQRLGKILPPRLGTRHSGLGTIGARDKFLLGGRARIARKILLHNNMLMIRSTINILPLAFTYFIICLKNKAHYHYDFERLALIGIQL